MVKSREKGSRPNYHHKCQIVLKAIKELVYFQNEWHLKRRDGFTMKEIAEKSGYARSQRFMETLYSMADDGLIEKIEYSGNGLADKHFVFRLPSSVKQTSFAS